MACQLARTTVGWPLWAGTISASTPAATYGLGLGGAQRARSSGVMAASSSGVHRIVLPSASLQCPFRTMSLISAQSLNGFREVLPDWPVGLLLDFGCWFSICNFSCCTIQDLINRSGSRTQFIVQLHALTGTQPHLRVRIGLDNVSGRSQVLGQVAPSALTICPICLWGSFLQILNHSRKECRPDGRSYRRRHRPRANVVKVLRSR